MAYEGEPLNVEGRDSSYSETLARVAALMDAERINQERISNMSQESAREFLNDVVIRIAQALGIAMARVAALIADVLEMARNAGRTFNEQYRTSYRKARQIDPGKG